MDDLELFEEDFLDPTGPHSNEEIDFESSSDDGSTPHYQVVRLIIQFKLKYRLDCIPFLEPSTDA